MEFIKVNTTQDMLAHKGKRAIILPADYVYDEGVMRVLGEKKSLIIFVSLDNLLKSRGMSRSRQIYKLRNFLKLCTRFGAMFVIGFESDAKSGSFTTREKEEVIALGELLGLNRGQAKMAVARFEEIFIKKEKNKLTEQTC